MSEGLHRVAVIGLGVGQLHVRSWRRLKDRFAVVAVADLDPARASAVAERVGAEVASFEEIIERDDIDVVDLCTPPAGHYDQITAALARGLHVVCEKPLVGSLAEADGLAAVERDRAGRVMPIFQYRFGNGLQKIKALVDGDVAGRAFTSSVEVAWRRRADYYAVPWRGRWDTELGGVLVSQAVHALDMLTYIVGPPARLFARVKTMVNDIEVEDCAAISLEMADGSLATVSCTLGSAEEITRHRFHFANLSAESGTAPYESSSDPWRITADTEEAAGAIDALLDNWAVRPEGWWGQFERYADFLDGKVADPPVTLTDARRALELVTALYASSRSGRDVALPIGADHPLYGGWRP